ncbi:hypothetical protein [Nocardia testacea]|uniref:Haem-binding uptake Tiki superfamily ChaN domain-containing protein n=1 Tax=Nocardia testacea TaxID=248551 RepID=A0ABW7VSN6_9NOCA
MADGLRKREMPGIAGHYERAYRGPIGADGLRDSAGRHDDAQAAAARQLNDATEPVRRDGDEKTDLPDEGTAGFTPDSLDSVVANRRSVDWNAMVGDHRAVLLGELHYNAPGRAFLAGQARAMREAGITHFGVEAPPHSAFDELNAGRPADLTQVGLRHLSGYEEMMRAMNAEGITVVPLDMRRSAHPARDAQEVRDRHMAATIDGILSEDPDTKVAALLGSLHTSNSPHFPPNAGAILHAGPHSTTSIEFTGGYDRGNQLATVARKHNAAGETFVADLLDYHNAG